MLQLPHRLTLSLSPFSASESHRHVQRSLHVPSSLKPVAGYHVMVSPSATGSPGSKGRIQQLWKIRSRAPSGASGREDVSASGQTPRGARLPFHHLSPSPFSPLSLCFLFSSISSSLIRPVLGPVFSILSLSSSFSSSCQDPLTP